jgi:hypothetical protein
VQFGRGQKSFSQQALKIQGADHFSPGNRMYVSAP